MKIGTWLLSMVQPLIGRILAALGFSVVTVVGFTATIETLRQNLISSVNALPADMLGIMLLAGVGESVGMILGAIAFRLALWQIQSATKIVGVNPT